MDISKISPGPNPPHSVHVVIEVPGGSAPVKYEMDKESGALFVDRFLSTSMVYPAAYGFIPGTLSGDGDPCDVLVLTPQPLVHGCVIKCRPIGALKMEDESGVDEKILAVPVDKLHPSFSGIKSYEDIPEITRATITHFFEHYKDLEKGKWVKVTGWVGPEEAMTLITEAIERAKKS